MGSCSCGGQLNHEIETDNSKPIEAGICVQQPIVFQEPQVQINGPQLGNGNLHDSNNSEHLSKQLNSCKNPILGSENEINRSQQEIQKTQNFQITQSFYNTSEKWQ